MDSIGPYTFIRLDGNPEPPRSGVEVVARAGVNGVGVYYTGRRGAPFTMRSTADFASLEAARTEFTQYQTLVDQDPVDMVWTGLNVGGNENCRYQVLAVRQVSLIAVRGLGGRAGTSGATLRAEWDLIAIEN